MSNLRRAIYGQKPAGGSIITTDLVLHLDAGISSSYPGTGSTWYDLSTEGNDGTLNNGVGYSSGYLTFDGVNDYVEIPDSSSLTSSNLTINAWVRATSITAAFLAIIGKGISDANEEYGCMFNSSNLYFDVGNQGPYTYPPYSFSAGTWYNICVVNSRPSSSSTLLCYVNGASISIGTVRPTYSLGNNSNPVSIGRRFYNNTANSFDGDIAHVSIYNKVLTPSEILENYNALSPRF